MCTHYWKFEPPNGATSRGVCEYCGAVQEAYNSVEDESFGRISLVSIFPEWYLKENPIDLILSGKYKTRTNVIG